MIFVNLNRCVLRDNFIEGEVWIPQEKFEKARSQLRNLGKEFLEASFHDTEEYKEVTRFIQELQNAGKKTSIATETPIGESSTSEVQN